jgi:hypothetical protein
MRLNSTQKNRLIGWLVGASTVGFAAYAKGRLDGIRKMIRESNEYHAQMSNWIDLLTEIVEWVNVNAAAIDREEFLKQYTERIEFLEVGFKANATDEQVQRFNDMMLKADEED